VCWNSTAGESFLDVPGNEIARVGSHRDKHQVLAQRFSKGV